MRENGEEVNRDNLIEGGRKLRSEGGPGILAELLLEANENENNFAIDSVRTPEEAKALKVRKDFKLIEVRASREARWERMKARGRKGDPTDYETFVQQEEAELKASDSSGQALDATAKEADIVIDNENDLNALFLEIDKLLED